MPKNVLIIAYEFPPAAGGGVARLTNYVRYLRAGGWTPVVLTGAPGAGRPRDATLLAQIEGVEVVRLPALNPVWALGRLTTSLRAALRGMRRTAGPAGSAPEASAARRRVPLTTRIARRTVFPDEAVLWARSVARIGPGLCDKHGIAVVLASGPPFSALHAGIEVGRRAGLPVVLDMRDQWRDNPGIHWPTQARRDRALRLERDTLSAAAAVVGATGGITTEALEMGARSAETVYNGFDPAQMPRHTPDPASPLRIAFLGRFGRDVMDPTTFFEGLAAAIRDDVGLAHIVVDVVGPEAPWVGPLVSGLGLSGNVIYHGFKPYAEALELVSRADVGMMCVADRPGSRDLFPGKLFDYLGIGMPLLFLGPADGAVADIIRGNGLGVAVRNGDVEAVANAIRGLATEKAAGRSLGSVDRSVTAQFERSVQVSRLAAILTRVAGDAPLG